MIVLDKLLAGGVGWVLRRVSDAANAELFDESALHEELLAAEMQLELGEIDETEYASIEASVLERLRGARAGGEHAMEPGARYTVEAIEADVGDTDHDIAPPSTPAPTAAAPRAVPAPSKTSKKPKPRRAGKARPTRVR
jgi:hypothetical protein